MQLPQDFDLASYLEATSIRNALSASFRDPAGCVYHVDGRVFRTVNQSAVEDLELFLSSTFAREAVEAGRIVRTDRLPAARVAEYLSDLRLEGPQGSRPELILEHDRIAFVSFPYEWTPQMLYAAGECTLDLAEAALAEGLDLKDASPYNVLFSGTYPVFVDILSFVRRDPRDSRWRPYAQFIRTFVLPLLANQQFGLPLDQIFFTRRDGLEPEDVARMCGSLQRLRSPVLGLATIPAWLNARAKKQEDSLYQPSLQDDPQKAAFILKCMLGQLRKSLRSVAPRPASPSAWMNYMASDNNYTADHFAAKERFCRETLVEHVPKQVLDVGCNTGYFSSLAAEHGAQVVAIDYDPAVVAATMRRAQAAKQAILPLVVNLTRPSPGIGWLNRECAPFLTRAAGAFDLVWMLAVVHHMLVTERVPLTELVDLTAHLTRDLVVLEYVDPQDSMFRRLTRGNEDLFAWLNVSVFESAFGRRFEILRRQHLDGTHRWLYLMRARSRS